MFALKRIDRVIKRSCVKMLHVSNVLLKKESEITNSHMDDILQPDNEFGELSRSYLPLEEVHNCFIIHPYVKWGPRKHALTPEEQIQEAEALVKTLSQWQVEGSIRIPLESLVKKSLFGSGNMKMLVEKIRNNPNISAVFVNVSNLRRVTAGILAEKFQRPIFDRYKIVIQILKAHATSKHAKLQVALAELYYIQRKAEQGEIIHTYNPDTLKLMFQNREQKIKAAIQKVREQRVLLRNQRKKLEYSVVAVVGYTNVGKTCLIKALTGDENLVPKNQLFATLDVTIYKGLLPSGMEVLYVDTVGFLSDLPTNLLECFIATLEDAVLADVILFVEDMSNSCMEYHRKHVLNTLTNLSKEFGTNNILEKIISVGNKSDCVVNKNYDGIAISAKEGTGLSDLRIQLENKLLEVTSRKKISIKVPNGGDEMRWLYKNATVISESADENDAQLTKLKIIITNANLNKFKHLFITSLQP